MDKIISESIRKTLSEMDWRTTDKALSLVTGVEYGVDKVLYAIREIDDFLAFYCERYEKSQDAVHPKSQAAKFRKTLKDIKNFVLRKQEQRYNIDDLHNYNFKKQHDNIDYQDYDDTIPDDDNAQLTPSQQEYIDWKW